MGKREREHRWSGTPGLTSSDVEKVSEHVRAFGKETGVYVVESFLRKTIVNSDMFGKITPSPNLFSLSW